MRNLQEIIHTYKEPMVQSLQECLKIPSVSGNTNEVLQALDYYLDLAKDMGFKSTNIENLGGVIEFGEGERTIGMIVHLDVVPEGSGWSFPPFEGKVQDGKIYGRGAIDDKGPAIAVLYALKAIKDSGQNLPCKVQIIVGIDEENVWSTTPKLLTKIKEPDFSFVPDSKFPIVIAEKGLIWLEIHKKISDHSLNAEKQTENAENKIKILSIQGGSNSINIVPDYCEAQIASSSSLETLKEQLTSYTDENGFKITLEEKKNKPNLTLISKGKPAHAFVCNEGTNAISQLLLFLNTLEIDTVQNEFINFYAKKFGMEFYGESLGLAMEDQVTGKLTVSPGYISMNPGDITLKIDIRFPATKKLDEVKNKVFEVFSDYKKDLKILDSLESLYFPEDDPNIQKLLKVYKDFSGEQEAKPLGMGGTTFSKAFRNAVAFGPTFPGMKKVEHQPDEYIEIEHMLRCTEIYAQAICELAKP